MKTLKLCILLMSVSLTLLNGQDTDQIDQLLTDWHNAAAGADQQKFFSFIDENGVYIGTDSTEIWTKQEFYDWSTPHFEKGKAWTFKATKRNIYFSDNNTVAWFNELIDYGSGTLRGSGVLQIRSGDWKIMQYVLSVPVPNEKFKEVMAIINK